MKEIANSKYSYGHLIRTYGRVPRKPFGATGAAVLSHTYKREVAMKHNRFLFTIAALLVVAVMGLVGCSDGQQAPASAEQPDAVPTVRQEILDELAELRRLAALPDRGMSTILGHSDAPAIVVPAGSVNALQAAVAAAGNNGKVILAAGVHTENTMVTVSQNGITIIGENGAILRSSVLPSGALTTVVDPAIYVYNAERVKIWNIDFRPVGTVAGTAVMLENAPKATVGACSIEDFQWGILLHNARGATISSNRIVASSEWLTGGLPECDGIININGKDVRIADNDVSNSVLGVFCSDEDGVFMHNTVHGNFVGVILCCVPDESFRLPSGAIVGSLVSGKKWMVQGNSATGNFYTGYLVIDGASHNHLVNNAAYGNGAYDIELLGGTCLFGFFTPTSFNNTVVVGSHQNITINDFGQNNRIIGHATVTNNISAPCP